ncbi:MAG: endolytic transglycosylase MltG [Lachnospiraceae bacterium]|nr:endolytic transglycosylase MltG [Lachnospiraceae bacterium]
MKVNKMVIKTVITVIKVVLAVVVVMFVYKGAMLAYDYGYRVFAEEPVDAVNGWDMDVVIEDGMGPKEIGALLESKGLIKDGTLFYLQNILSKYKGDLKAGTYVLNTSMTTEEMMAVMSGESTGE